MRLQPLLTLLALCLAVDARAEDWPQWRGPARTGHVSAGVTVPATLPAEPKVLWRVKVGDGLASPVISSGVVFQLDNQNGQEVLHALDAADGHELWRTNIDRAVGDNQSPAGPRCTPLVSGNRIYVQSMLGELRCLSTADGSQLWHVSYPADLDAAPRAGESGSNAGAARHGYAASPVVDGDTLYTIAGGVHGASVVAFDKATGRVLWKSQDDPAAYAAPFVAEIDGTRQLVAFTSLGVIGLHVKDGRLLWRVPLTTSLSRHAITPVVTGNLVVVGSYTLGLVGIHVSHTGDNWLAEKAWTSMDSAPNFSSPVAVGDYIYGLGPTKNLFCVDITTGKQTWSKQGYLNGGADKAYSAFLVMGENILVLTDSGELVLHNSDPKAFKEISRIQVCGKTWCSPAYADAKLYLRDNRELLCLDLLH